jgi:NAD(P)-dependent dehydrogenase (short-subunit alcohol dehydrogenase family)
MRDRVVLVAGASGGVGRAIGAELLAEGADVILLGRSDARLRAAISPADGEKAEYLEADLTDGTAIERVRRTVARRRDLDALILSSGIYERSDSPMTFARQVAANLLGPYALIQALLPMLLRSQGQIVFINSSQALRAGATVGQYAATMHATKAVADSLREEVNERGVRVMSLYLGRTAGDRQKQIFELEGRPYPPEILIQPSDVARTVVYLLRMPRTAEVTDLMMRPMRKN